MVTFARLRALLLAAALAALLPVPALADGGTATGPGSHSAKARLDFRIRIPAIAWVRSSGHAPRVDIRAEDVERGFVEVRRARIAVRANMRGQKRLVAQVVAAFAESVQIDGLPQPVLAQPEGVSPLWGGRGAVVDGSYEVHYRIRLAPGVTPGVYPWPVFLKLEVA
jgi:hypothetical protein